MVFKTMLQKFGVCGPTVDTMLDDPRCRPGSPLSGEVRLVGGEADAEIEHIALSLTTRVLSGRGGQAPVEFSRAVVAGATRLAAKEQRTIPFTLPPPWEAPLTEVSGQRLPGMDLGVRTELSIAKAVDKGDLDPVFVAPLPSQDAVLDAFGQLGFHFQATALTQGQPYGVRQELPFFQQLVFSPPAQFLNRINAVALTFTRTADGMTVLLELAGFPPGSTPAGRFQVSHEAAVEQDWAPRVDEWLEQVAQHSLMRPGYGHPQYGHRQRQGPGMGGVVAGAAAGVVGGMMLGEMLDGDDEGGDE